MAPRTGDARSRICFANKGKAISARTNAYAGNESERERQKVEPLSFGGRAVQSSARGAGEITFREMREKRDVDSNDASLSVNIYCYCFVCSVSLLQGSAIIENNEKSIYFC